MADLPHKPAKVMPLRAQHPCPICGQRSIRDDYPFCSRRCANVDLNAWLDGRYAIAASEEDDGSGAP